VIICEIFTHLLVIVKNKKNEIQITKYIKIVHSVGLVLRVVVGVLFNEVVNYCDFTGSVRNIIGQC
jgi:hypothetical protein